MFDEFNLHSGNLFFSRKNLNEDWIVEAEERHVIEGTAIQLKIKTNTDRSIEQVFNEYTNTEGDYAFARTHVPVFLTRYGEEQLVSRSQAKRLLARFELFDVVVLDFQGVEFIGQAFADEVFRVFGAQHPKIKVTAINMSEPVQRMMRRSEVVLASGR